MLPCSHAVSSLVLDGNLLNLVKPTFQPFTMLDGVTAKDVPFYGGLSSLSDYCPFWRVSEFDCSYNSYTTSES